MKSIQLKILDPRIGVDIPLPHLATDGSAGMDMRACIDEELVVESGETHLIPTGLAIYIANNNLAAIFVTEVRIRA
jgi:dUTP pyrophosphatase